MHLHLAFIVEPNFLLIEVSMLVVLTVSAPIQFERFGGIKMLVCDFPSPCVQLQSLIVPSVALRLPLVSSVPASVSGESLPFQRIQKYST